MNKKKCHDRKARQDEAEEASWDGRDGILSTTPSKSKAREEKAKTTAVKVPPVCAPNVTILMLVK